MSNKARHRMSELTNEIRDHQFKYHVLDTPSIPDGAFDALLLELKDLEAKHPELREADSPTLGIGGGFATAFTQRENLQRLHHETPQPYPRCKKVSR